MYSIYVKNEVYCIRKDPNGKYESLGDVNRKVKELGNV